MINIQEHGDLSGFLDVCIDTLRSRYSNFSISQIARKINVPTSTFSRIANGEIKRPAFEASVAIAQSVCEPSEVQDFISKFFPELTKNLNRIYSGNAEAKRVEDEIEEMFADSSSHELLMKATSSHGVSFDEVKLELGEKGINILQQLLEFNLLKNEGSRFFYDGSINASQSTVRKLLLNLLQTSYDLDNFGPARNMLTLQYESVNTERVYPKLRKIIDGARQSVRELFNDKENQGKDVVWFSLAMDTLHTSKNGMSSKGVLQ